jgi:parvulin-like peptidyl-prolyl isomerase
MDDEIATIAAVDVTVRDGDMTAFLKTKRQYHQCYEKLLHHRIIRHAAQQRQITVTPQEVQTAADLFRHQQRLQRAADTVAWLEHEMIEPSHWEQGIQDDLLMQKLADVLFAQQIEPLFAQNRLHYEKLVMYQLLVGSAKLAKELFYQIQEAEISFYEAAHLYDCQEERRQRCGFEGLIARSALAPEFAAAVMTVPLGQVVAPIETTAGHHLLMVEAIQPPELTPEVRDQIQQALFDEWLQSEMNYWLYR